MSKNGVYLVEELDTGDQAYNANVFIERCKELLDFFLTSALKSQKPTKITKSV